MAYVISRPWGGQCGIGHQFHNWLTGYLLANRYDLTFVHSPFCGGKTWFQTDTPLKKWEEFLGFGRGFITESQLPPNIKRIALPHVSWDEVSWHTVTCDHSAWRDTIEQHRDEDVLFECSRDQFIGLGWKYFNTEKLRENYWYTRSLWPIASKFDNNKINVAIHIRRGDVTEQGRYKVRWVADCVYQNVIDQVRVVYPNALFHIYSDGTQHDLRAFISNDVMVHSRENVFETFHRMVSTDILMPGQSAFSVLAGHLCGGIIIARAWSPMWDNFPFDKRFIVVDQKGEIKSALA